ncbi:MAG: hypothetical protein IJ121_07135 [Eubacterium sp.]|nr:hypothetical protein [Eubacterium sp.]
MDRRNGGCRGRWKGLAALTLAAGMLFAGCGTETAKVEQVSDESEVPAAAVSQIVTETPAPTPTATPVSTAAPAETEQTQTSYGLAEIPAEYSIYKNAAGNYSFLYADAFNPEELEDADGVILYTDQARVNYVCVFTDSSGGEKTEDYLDEIEAHFRETVEENGYEVWKEPEVTEALIMNGRTLQGIRYGYTVNGSRREYTDYIEEVTDGRVDNIVVYEQHVAEGSNDTTSLALQDAVASFVPQAGFYENVPLAEPEQTSENALTAENSTPEFQIAEDELVYTSDLQNFSVILPEYVMVVVSGEDGRMTVYCSGNGDYPTVMITRIDDVYAKEYIEQMLANLSADENVNTLPSEVERFGVNGQNAYRFDYYAPDADGNTCGKTLAAVNTDGGIALFEATYYDAGWDDLNIVMSRATESFRPSAAAYTG